MSQGCKHCYAETMHKRLRAMHQPKYQKHFLDGVVTHPDTLTIPLQWKKPRTVFVNSMSDLFHADVPFAFIDQVFAIMALTPQHTYQILTKRPERMAEYCASREQTAREWQQELRDGKGKPNAVFTATDLINLRWLHVSQISDGWVQAIGNRAWPLPNVWLGTSVEDQATANERIPHLLRVPAAVRFLSCEPLLGPLRIQKYLAVCPQSQHVDGVSHGERWCGDDPYTECVWCGEVRSAPSGMYITKRSVQRIHWLITGGESGPKARPMHPDWARSLRDQCAAAGVPFFFKQWGHWSPIDMPWEQADPKLLDFTERWMNIEGGHGYHGEQVWRMRATGKHASGNLLDGRTHQEYPITAGTATSNVTPSNAVTPGLTRGLTQATTQPATT